MRTFIVIPIFSNIKRQLTEVQSQLKTVDVHITWVNPKILHITLEFLGDVEEEKINLVSAAIEKACQQVKPFELKLEGLKLIPNIHRPRVIAISVGGDLETFWQLKNKIRQELQALGFEFEEGKSSHITLGRIKGKLSLHANKYFAQISSQPLGFKIKKVIFVKSILTQVGPVYTPIAEIPFRLKG